MATTDFWNGTGSWTPNTSNWSLGSPPTPAEDAEIQTGTDTLTTATTIAGLQVDAAATLQLTTGGTIADTGLGIVAGQLFLQNGASVSTGAGLSIIGNALVEVDGVNIGGGGGSSLTIGGLLSISSTNGNALDIGNAGISVGDTVTATGLSSTGAINIVGSASVQSTLNITTGPAGFGAVGVETGSVLLQNDSLLEFAGGQIGTIDGSLELVGANARIADAGTLATNSALIGLKTVAGVFELQNGASVGTGAGLSIIGNALVEVDGVNIGGGGGSSLTIGGLLSISSTNGNALDIGNAGISVGDTVTATGLSSTGAINIVGNASVQSTLNITTGPAGFGAVGVETGSVLLQNDSLLEFAGGQIGTIDGSLELVGANARIADAGTLATNSALIGLKTVAGVFELQNGASVSTGAGLSIIGNALVEVDGVNIGGGGGSSLTIGGLLSISSTNGNALDIGNTGISVGDTVTATGLSSTGAINIVGSASVQSTLNITTGPAGFGAVGVETGSVFLQNDSLLEFAGGQIGTIDGSLELVGANARIADAGTLATNSALIGLKTVTGVFELQNGASVGTGAGLSIIGNALVEVDGVNIGGGGGSSLTIGGLLSISSTNGNALDIGNTGISVGDTVTATGLSSTGAINIVGSASVQSTLNITTGPAGFGAAGVETGSVFLQNDSLLEFAGGQIGTIDGSLELVGANARIADAGTLATNSALIGLKTVAGVFELQNGASVSTGAGLSIIGNALVEVDGVNIGGGGGSSLTIGGLLSISSTNGNALDIGNTGISVGDTVTATGLSSTGAINIVGNASALGMLVVNGAAITSGTVNISASGEVLMGAGDAYTQAAGSTNIAAGGTLVSATVNVTGGSLDGTGTADGTVSNNGGGAVYGGLSLGTPGTLTISGSYNQSGTGILEANIANNGNSSGVVGISSGNFVNLSGGTLLLSSTPAIGVPMTVMTFGAGDLIGQFAHVQDGASIGDGSNVNLGDGTALEVFYNSDIGNIQVERVNAASLASSYHWIDGTGNWSTASDWSGGQVPNPTSNVVIGDTTTGNVTLNSASGDTTVNSLSILASNVLTVIGVTLTSATGGSGISVAAGATLSLTNGEINGSVLSGAGLLQTVNGSGSLAADTISANTSFIVTNNTELSLLGTITNQGSIDVDSGGNLTDLLVGSGTVTLTGGGGVLLSSNPGNRIYSNVAGAILDNVNNDIAGAGEIGVNGNLTTLINGVGGVINANQSSALRIDSSLSVTNNGLLEATSTAGLAIVGGNIIDSTGGGLIQANGAGAHVDMANATFEGGTLSTSGGGVIQTTGSGTLNGTASPVVITAGSTLQIDNNTTLILLGTITNHGTIADNSVGNLTDIIAGSGTVTLNGGGRVVLSDNSANRIYAGAAGALLDNVNNTISGAGEIGVNGNLTLQNQALIDANAVTALTIDASNPVQNTGTIRSSDTTAGNGGLVLNATVIDDTGASNSGLITAIGANTHVDIRGGTTIKGGTITTSGGGVVQVVNSSSGTLDGTAAPLTISTGSTVLLTNDTSLNLAGTINAQGVINLDSTGNLTDLIIAGASVVKLTGPGGISMSSNSANRIYGASSGAILDNVNSVIAGAGEIGVNGNLTLKNESLVDANASVALTIDSPNTVQNTGTLRSSNTTASNGGLVLRSTTIDNTGKSNVGQIIATGVNTHVDIVANTLILGGTLIGTGGGVFNVSNSTLDGSTAGAPINIATGTPVEVGNNNDITLNGTINNKGTIALNSVGNLTDMIVGANGVLLQGDGVITLSDNSGNRIYTNTTGSVLENVNNTISGAGNIFQNSGMILKNDTAGVIVATGTNALVIGSFSTNPVQNIGLIESTAGTGGLVITASTIIDNTGNSNAGKIVASGTGTHVDLDASSTILGGTLTGTNGGVFNVSNSTLDGSAAGAPINIATGTPVEVGNNNDIALNGTINNKGTIALNSVGNFTDMIIGANGLLLQGGGVISLSDNSGNRIYSNTAGVVLENVNNTISGAGNIFQNSGMTLKNDAAGVIDATGANALVIGSFSANPVQNTGLIETTSGTGGLVITGSTTIDNTGNANAGLLTANGTGTHIDINNSTIRGGTLTGKNSGVFNGASSTLDGSTAGAPVNIVAGTVLNYGNNTTNFLAGTINNAGKVAENSSGNLTDLLVDAGGATLTGGGLLVLSDNANNRIYSSTAATVLTNANNTISGAGDIFASGGLSLVNSSTINATGSNALTLGLNITNNASGILEGSGTGGLIINAGTTTNNGLVEALNASAVTYTPGATDANNVGGILTGGTWSAITTGGGATVSITDGAVTTDAATIILSGVGSVFQAGDGNTFTKLENSLTTIASTGELDILNARNYVLGVPTLTDNGKIVLGGGTISGGALPIGATGELTGFGMVTDVTTNSGIIDANGSDLDVTTAISGTGKFQIETASELELGGATAEVVTYEAASGKLRIDNPATANYTGTINGFAGNDILELASTNATSATPGAFNGSTTTLTVNLSGGGTKTYTLAGNYASDNFLVTHVNGNADSDITLTTITSGRPAITAPGTATVGVGQTNPVSGISVSESSTTSGETFTAVLTDTNGVLAANTGATGGGGAVTPSNGGKTLTISGSLAQVNADLTTLTDTDGTTPSDTIAVNASDSNGGAATAASISVTVNSLPAITAPTVATVAQNSATTISGVSVSESGNTTTSGETFTAVVADGAGVLSANTSATGGGGTITPSNGGKTLTITGTLTQVDADLTTLTDADASTASDTITVNAHDSFGNVATQHSIAVTVTPASGSLAITAPGTATVGVGQTNPIIGISVSESPTTGGETFTAVLADTNGVLAANTGASGGGGSVTPSNGGKTLTITGTLAQVNADLTTLTDTDGTLAADTITVHATDSNGGSATSASIAVTVNGLPVITAPAAEAIGVGKTALVPGGALTESGNTAGETFTVTVADTHGLLTATAGSAVVTGGGTTSLTIKGSLSAVSTALGTLGDTDGTAGSDTITVNTVDSFGNAATQTTTAITVNGLPVITAPTAEAIGVGRAALVPGGALTESGNTAGETFTVTVADTHGLLTATAGSAVVTGGGTTSLTIKGSLSAVSTALGTLGDTDGTVGSDTITVNTVDSFGNAATQTTTAITVNGLPVITAPTAETIGVGQAALVPGGALTESGDTAGETFTVTVADTHGLLTATAGSAVVTGGGTTSLTIKGSLSAVSTALGTLGDTDGTAGSDTITVNTTDGFGNVATQTTTAITVNSLPAITAPTVATVAQNSATTISGVSVSESGNTTTSGETFTAVVADGAGVLSANTSATGGGGTITPSNGGKTLTITGTLTQVDADLTTLTDADASTASDTITVNAHDSFGNFATQRSIVVTVTPASGSLAITAPGTATVGVGQTNPITGISVSESPTTGGETFTAVLADTNGVLAANTGASGGGGSVTPSNGGKTLTITGTLAQVNADLTTLTDTDGTLAADTITVHATDSNGGSATSASIAVTVNGLPVITAPAAETIGVGKTALVPGGALTESGNTAGETFTVTVADTHGLLTATAGSAVVTGGGTTSLTIKGSLSAVSTALGTLGDTDGTAGSDTITVNTVDSFGNAATQTTTAIMVNSLPFITAPTIATVAQNTAASISGVSVSETGNITGETFTAVVSDTNGVLAASTSAAGGGGTVTSSNGGKTLTIAGTLVQLNADLSTLTDNEGSTAADAVTINASDSFGNTATSKTIAVTVQPPAGQTFTLTTGADAVAGGAGNDTINASTNTLSTGDQINGGGGTNVLNLIGGGIFNLSVPATLTNVQVVNAQEGQAANGSIVATNQSITLRAGLNVTVNVSAATVNASNPKVPTITVNGANDSSVINLASGNDVVTLGSANETVNGGTGNDQFQVTAATIGATINGGTGSSTLNVLGGGTNVTMGSNITNISAVMLASAPSGMSFIANGISGLTINDLNTHADTVTAGGLNQTLTGGAAGMETFVGFTGGSTTFKDLAAALNGDTIANFFASNSQIDLTNVAFASLQAPTFVGGQLRVSDGTHTAVMTLTGTEPGGTFTAQHDSGIGTLIRFA